MPLLARTVNTPLIIEVRRGAIADLGPLLADQRISAGGDVAVVVGPGQGERIVELIRPTLGSADVFTVAGGTLDAALELGDKLRARSYDAVVGIGGGKTIDTAKYAAARYGIPMVSVATSLANDGIASPIATLDHDGGRPSYGAHIPIAVVVDLDFVESGPDLHNRAGIGELLSNISALADWELAREMCGERVDGLAATLARTGAEAIINHPGDMTDDGFVTILAESLIASGLAMAISGTSRPCSGGCHEIMHAMHLLRLGTGSHGEQVGLGGLFCTFLRGDLPRFRQMASCLHRHGLPILPADLALTDDQFVDVVLHAPRTRPDRYTIIEHLDLSPDGIRDRLADYADALRDHLR
ncbi:iron-containing alcohol dehydrogenase family protein [Micromonospora sp. NBC_01796]|uniref:iron-containing alcohol dehydrogenase family protein n=1 Tax=Micromonospora sp. NBC_01796 TaxID=2975987 RepID=UPI002DD8EDE1|nr:iron-containing alcohol dehydrogenase family protein [Micromonospora sp. NBC_01796]WSA88452.1 iron-containing alcohol dehydrogenase family protein [Micromonospora sp. NBC_01796]